MKRKGKSEVQKIQKKLKDIKSGKFASTHKEVSALEQRLQELQGAK